MRGLLQQTCTLLAIAASCLPLIGLPTLAAEKPNIVWLISEDNSIHYMKMFDAHGAETPHIQQLAEHGLQFEQAFSNAPVCSVARTTLMTGCYAPRIGTQFHRRAVSVPMPENVAMFPAYLRTAGYYTTNNKKKDYNADESPGTWDQSSDKASWRNRRSDQPFFHMQSFASTHESSLHFNQESFENSPTSTDPESVFVAPYHPDTELFRYTVARYHDNIRKMDAQIGDIVEQLRQDELLDDTFIFYFGDHGGVLPRGKGYAYESGLHVPLVVYVPKNFQNLIDRPLGSSVPGFVQFIDFGATVLKLAGLEPPVEIDGRPFLGQRVSAKEVDARDEAFGYADRFDEKYDLVRTLRKGKYEYVRSYQPFNFDGLQNNYRYIMLAYQQWRELYQAGQLNATRSAFFRPRPAEMLFDIEADPHEVHDLAEDPAHAAMLAELRERLRTKVKSLPDLSFYPESYLVENAFDHPVAFGQRQQSEIAAMVDVADLSLLDFSQARGPLLRALNSESPWIRYWGLIVCSCFGREAAEFVQRASELKQDANLLVRTRAAEFLGLIGAEEPQATLLDCLQTTQSGVEANLILNSVVLLRDGSPGYEFDPGQFQLQESVSSYSDVLRRLSYLESANGIPKDPQGKRRRGP